MCCHREDENACVNCHATLQHPDQNNGFCSDECYQEFMAEAREIAEDEMLNPPEETARLDPPPWEGEF